MLNIIVDAMGGDNAPFEVIRGCVKALSESNDFKIILVGKEDVIKNCLSEYKYDENRIEIQNATTIINNDEAPTLAIKNKNDSSLVKGFNLLKEGKGDALISAGSTGAIMVGSLFLIGRIKGIKRPAVAPIVPSSKGYTMIIDAGMNTVCRPINFIQFAVMGSIYMEKIMKIKNPKVGLINVGTEDGKGNKKIKEVFSALQDIKEINFVGNIESSDITKGTVDIVVCDGFVGNSILKMMEGTSKLIVEEFRRIFANNIFSKLGYLFIKNKMKAFSKTIDPNELGGTSILGVNALIYKCHGNANYKAFKNTIIKIVKNNDANIIETIKNAMTDLS